MARREEPFSGVSEIDPPFTAEDEAAEARDAHLDTLALLEHDGPHNLVLRQVCTDCGKSFPLPDFVKAER